MMESEIVTWLLRPGSSLLGQMPSTNFSWDDAERPENPQVVARRGDSQVEYNIGNTIDFFRTEVTFECYAGRTVGALDLSTAVASEMALLSGGDIFFTLLKTTPDRGFHRETGRYRRDVVYEVVHRR